MEVSGQGTATCAWPLRSLPAGFRDLSAGFTLIELLVVVLIIGVMATLAGVALGNRSVDGKLENEAQRLEKLLELALEEAEAKGIELGFRHTRETYEFLTPGEEGRWEVIGGTGPLRARELPPPLALSLCVEGRPVPPGMDRDNPKVRLVPQVMMFSSGEQTPFVLDVEIPRHDSYYRLTGEVLGGVSLERGSGVHTCTQGKR